MFSEIMRYILDLGPTVMLPIVIIIFSKILGMKLGDCFKSGLHIGIGFVGIGLVIGLMLDSIGPAAKAMAEHFQINLHVIDIGWPGSSPMTWASQIALVAIPIAIAVNIFMLVTRMTRVVNVDIWNIWHMAFTGIIVQLATGYANALAALETGAAALDASIGGFGGCPFAPAATGNIASEDLVYALDRSGVHTGVDLESLASTATWLGARLSKDVPAQLGRAGNFPPS